MIIKDFTAVLAVGIEGIALMSLQESLSKESPCDIEGSQVLDDIQNCSIQEWFDYLPIKEKPARKQWVYSISGTATFHMDGAKVDDVIYTITEQKQ